MATATQATIAQTYRLVPLGGCQQPPPNESSFDVHLREVIPMPSTTVQLHTDTCCICHREYALVWNMPGYANLWVHLDCATDAQQQAKEKLAYFHLRTARQHGETMIGQTRKGTVRLSYYQGDRSYTLDQLPTHTQNPYAIRLSQGRKAVVQPVLMQLYKVQ